MRRSRPVRAIRRSFERSVTYLVLAVLAIPFIFPVYWMIASALKPLGEVLATPPALWPTSPQWDNFLEVFREGQFARQFFNSTYIAAFSTIGVLLISSLSGYAFARIKFRGSTALFVMLLSALLIPAEVTIIPLFRMMDWLGWIDTHLPLIVLPVFGGICVLSTFIMRQFFITLPSELEDAGRVDGLDRLGLFWHIALPLARPALAAVAILAFLSSWNEFLEPLVFLRSVELWTIPLALYTFADPYTGVPIWNLQMAATSLSVIPVLAVFVLAQRHFVRGLTGTGLK